MVQLDDLNDDCLIEVLDRLTPNQLFKLLPANKGINRLANIMIPVKITAIELYRNEQNKYSSISQFNFISDNQVLVLGPKFKNLEEPSTKSLLLNLLIKCSGIKSIDFCSEYALEGFRNKPFPSGLLLEVVRLCPEIECIKLGKSRVKEAEWNQVFDLIGNQIVYFMNHWYYTKPADVPSETRLLEMIAEKCPNIKRVDWCGEDKLTSDLVAAFKLLPKNCWTTYDCYGLSDAFEDVFDELDLFISDWSVFGRRVNRLSKLTVNNLELTHDNVCGVEFAGLKKLKLNETPYPSEDKEKSISCLFASRFPKLEKFTFFASDGFSEDYYDKIFQQMVLVKKLAIEWKLPLEQSVVGELPQSAIFHLKNLELIKLDIFYLPKCFNPINLLQQLEQYVDKISSLKKLIVVIHLGFDEWKKMVEDKVKQMKLKQNRVEIALIQKSE